MATEPRLQLNLALVAKLGRRTSDRLPHRLPREPQLPDNLANRLLINPERPSDPTNRFRRHHPRHAPPTQLRGAFDNSRGGSLFDAVHPQSRVTLPRCFPPPNTRRRISYCRVLPSLMRWQTMRPVRCTMEMPHSMNLCRPANAHACCQRTQYRGRDSRCDRRSAKSTALCPRTNKPRPRSLADHRPLEHAQEIVVWGLHYGVPQRHALPCHPDGRRRSLCPKGTARLQSTRIPILGSGLSRVEACEGAPAGRSIGPLRSPHR